MLPLVELLRSLQRLSSPSRAPGVTHCPQLCATGSLVRVPPSLTSFSSILASASLTSPPAEAQACELAFRPPPCPKGPELHHPTVPSTFVSPASPWLLLGGPPGPPAPALSAHPPAGWAAPSTALAHPGGLTLSPEGMGAGGCHGLPSAGSKARARGGEMRSQGLGAGTASRDRASQGESSRQAMKRSRSRTGGWKEGKATVPAPSPPSTSSGGHQGSGSWPLGGCSSGQLINVLAEKGKAPLGGPKDNHRPLGAAGDPDIPDSPLWRVQTRHPCTAAPHPCHPLLPGSSQQCAQLASPPRGAETPK